MESRSSKPETGRPWNRRPWFHPLSLKRALTRGKRKGDMALRVGAPVSTAGLIAWALELDLHKLSELATQAGQAYVIAVVLVGMAVMFMLRVRDLTSIGRELVEQQKFTVEAIRILSTRLDEDIRRIDGRLREHSERLHRLDGQGNGG